MGEISNKILQALYTSLSLQHEEIRSLVFMIVHIVKFIKHSSGISPNLYTQFTFT